MEECVNSVFAQTYKDFEIILIDDGSTDSTLSICQSLTEKDERIKLVKQDHAGVSNARNKGLEVATGKYVFFLDSDDVIHPFLLKTLVHSLESTDAKIAGSSVVNITESSWNLVSEKCAQDISTETTYLTFDETLEAVFTGETPLNCIGGVMMERALIGETKFDRDIHIGEDFLFIYENLIKGTSTVFLNKKMYFVRLHKKNTSWDFDYSGFLSRFRRREYVWKSEEKAGRFKYAKIQKRDALACYTACLKHHKINDKEVKKMRKTIRKYSSILFPALHFKAKIVFLVSVTFPFLYPIYAKIKK